MQNRALILITGEPDQGKTTFAEAIQKLAAEVTVHKTDFIFYAWIQEHSPEHYSLIKGKIWGNYKLLPHEVRMAWKHWLTIQIGKWYDEGLGHVVVDGWLLEQLGEDSLQFLDIQVDELIKIEMKEFQAYMDGEPLPPPEGQDYSRPAAALLSVVTY